VCKRFLTSMIAMTMVAAVVSVAPAPAAGQPLPTPATTWKSPLTPDGQPDIGGHWTQQNEVTTYSIQAGVADREEHTRIQGSEEATGRPIVDPPDGRIPYQPWAAERARFLYEQHLQPSQVEYLDPVSRSFLDGVPRINYRGTMRVVQSPGYVVIINEFNHAYRVIPIDGSPHIGADLKLWMGDSRGHWEGNTLVVDVTNHNEHTWFDIVGSFHSDALHLVERWTFVSPERIDYEVTISDPKVYARHWRILVNMGRVEDYEIWEEAIWEGNDLVENVMGAPPEVKRSPW
jgi:hypothetical protein